MDYELKWPEQAKLTNDSPPTEEELRDALVEIQTILDSFKNSTTQPSPSIILRKEVANKLKYELSKRYNDLFIKVFKHPERSNYCEERNCLLRTLIISKNSEAFIKAVKTYNRN